MECEQLSNHKENHCNYNGETVKSIRPISIHSNVYNHVNNLAVSRNVKTPSTMIKVTYNKGSKSPALQTFDGMNDIKVNNGELLIPLTNPLPLKKKSYQFGDGINSARSDNPLSRKDEREQDNFMEKNNVKSEVDSRINQNGCKVVGSADAKQERKSLHFNRAEASIHSPLALIDPSKDSRKHSETGARVKEESFDEKTSVISGTAPRDLKTRVGSSEKEKENLERLSKSIVRSEPSKTNRNESDRSGEESESDEESKPETANPTKQIRKRKSDTRENKTPVKKMKRSIVGDEKEILFDDEHLPPGWQRFIHTRKGGSSDGQNDVHILSPNGKIFRFRGALKKYLEEEKLPYSIDDFYFGLYKRKSDLKEASQKQDKEHSDAERLQRKKLSKNGKAKTGKEIPSSKTTKSDNLPSVEKTKNEYKVKREIIMNDPDLPPGWRRCIIIRSSGKYKIRRISFISPDGKKFKQKKRLGDYLASIKSPFSIDQFDFDNFEIGNGINKVINHKVENKDDASNISGNRQVMLVLTKLDDNGGEPVRSENNENLSATVPCGPVKDSAVDCPADSDENSRPEIENRAKPRYRYSHPPMRVDPDLPEGWHRSIKVRSTGESAGRMEVIINSPDGRKHRNKGALDQYLKQQKLPYKVDDFDFTLFGKNFKKPSGGGEAKSSPKFRRSFHFCPKESPKEKEIKATPESLAIEQVSGTMVACGITAVRNERRLRSSKAQHEKVLKDYVESNDSSGAGEDDSSIPEKWIRDLARCRSEFGSLQENAASAIASATKEFLQELALQALKKSKCPEKGLEYDDLASLVANSECLSCLKPFIPKKITFREFVKLNRPTKFSSFT